MTYNSRFLLLLFCISLFIRVIVFVFYLRHDKRYWQVDSATYNTVACHVANGNGLTTTNNKPLFYRVPGYSLFLSVFYYYLGANPLYALIGQLIVAACIPCLVFLLCLYTFPHIFQLAIFTSILSAIHPGFVLYSGFLMTESLFLIFFLLFLIFFLPILRQSLYGTTMKKSFFHLLYAGLSLGCASLIRPVGHYILIVSLFLILFCIKKIKNKFYKALILIGSWLLIVGPWLIRNYLLSGYLFFHTLPGGHFLYLSAARVAAQVTQCSYVQARENLKQNVTHEIAAIELFNARPLQEIEHCIVLEKHAKRWFFTYPLVSLKLWILDIFRATFSLYSAEIHYLETDRKEISYFESPHTLRTMILRYLLPYTQKTWVKALIYSEIVFNIFLWFGIAMTICAILRSKIYIYDSYILFIMAIFIGLFLGIALAGGYARMRLPIESLLFIISSYWYISKLYYYA